MEFLDRVYKKSDSIVSRKIADEFILVPIRLNAADLQNIYSLNEVAARIWELTDGKMRVREIRDKILEEFEVTSEEAEKDLANLLVQMEAIGALRKIR